MQQTHDLAMEALDKAQKLEVSWALGTEVAFQFLSAKLVCLALRDAIPRSP